MTPPAARAWWLAGLSVTCLASEDPEAWIYFDSRETAAKPRLVLELADGSTREIPPEADTLLIGYIAEGVFGSHAQLSVNLCDTNRVLMRFSLGEVRPPRSARLVLSTHPSMRPPAEDFDVAIHAVEESWSEGQTSWNTQPSFADETVVASCPQSEGRFEVDVTDLVRGWASGERANHGLLIRVAEPLTAPSLLPPPPASASEPAPPASLDDVLLSTYEWAPDVDAALDRARELGRPVLALVTAGWGAEEPVGQERILHSTAFAHPWVRELVRARFVPVRVHTDPTSVAVAMMDPTARPDPLAPLGTDLVRAKPAALVVADEGGAREVLASMGSFEGEHVWRFLVDALPDDEPPAESASDFEALLAGGWLAETRALLETSVDARERLDRGLALAERDGDLACVETLAAERIALGDVDAGEAWTSLGIALLRSGRATEARPILEAQRGRARAAYWLAALEQTSGDRARADRLLQAAELLEPESPWFGAIAARRAHPEVVSMFAPFARTTRAEAGAIGEEELVDRARAYLLETQLPGGDWPIPDPRLEDYRAGIAVLCAHALFVHGADERARAAVERAGAWFENTLAPADAAELNSFAATYWLDYQLERRARGAAGDEDARAAVELLLGGQMTNGAWSYSKSWGESWRGGFAGWPATERGRAHSMNTGIALEALTRAKEAGIEVDERALARGAEALLAMRRAPAAYTYTWPDPDIYGTVKSSIARAPACELALWRLGRVPVEDVRTSIAQFMDLRDELAAGVKLTGSWLPPHAFSGYFYLFGYYHAARVIAAVEHPECAAERAALRSDILAAVDPDATWMDFTDAGKPYGTAMALLILHETK